MHKNSVLTVLAITLVILSAACLWPSLNPNCLFKIVIDLAACLLMHTSRPWGPGRIWKLGNFSDSDIFRSQCKTFYLHLAFNIQYIWSSFRFSSLSENMSGQLEVASRPVLTHGQQLKEPSLRLWLLNNHTAIGGMFTVHWVEGYHRTVSCTSWLWWIHFLTLPNELPTVYISRIWPPPKERSSMRKEMTGCVD